MLRGITALVFLLSVSGGTEALGRLKVVSTVPDFAAIASEIGGDLVDVSSMVRPTQDPHFLDAKPSFVLGLNKADLLLLVGMELEGGWLPPLLLAARNPRIQRGSPGYLDCSTLISPMGKQAADRSKGDVHPGGNPHYWTDPRNGVLLAWGITKRLAQLDPKHAATYEERGAAFVQELEQRISGWRKMLEPFADFQVAVYHKSWIYFLDFAGLTEMGALEPKPGIPPSPAHVAALIQTAATRKVRLVLQESFYPTTLSRQFAAKTGAKLLVLPTMTGAGGTTSYVDLVNTIVTEVVQALTAGEM